MVTNEKYVKSHSIGLWTQSLRSDINLNGDTCILISGAGAPAMFWTNEFCHHLISAGFNVIRFDHRDQGLSDSVDWDRNPYTIDDLAKDVIAILDAYQIEKAHVVGHSMGGMIAQWLAIQYRI